jgi:hypothetical protein
MDFQNALEFVQLYYEHTWNNLLWLFGISFGAIGIIVPFMIQWIQSKNNKEQIKEATENSKVLFDSKTNDMNDKFDDKLNQVSNKVDEKILELNKEFNVMQNDLFFVQGCMYITQGNILVRNESGDLATTKILHSFLYAAFCFLTAGRYENLKFVNKTLMDIMNSQNFPEKIPGIFDGIDVKEVYDITVSLFDKKNDDGKYSTIIKMLKEKIIFIN